MRNEQKKLLSQIADIFNGNPSAQPAENHRNDDNNPFTPARSSASSQVQRIRVNVHKHSGTQQVLDDVTSCYYTPPPRTHSHRSTKKTVTKPKNSEILFPLQDDDSMYTCFICGTEYYENTGHVACSDFYGKNPGSEIHKTCTVCFRNWARASVEMGVAFGGIGLRCVDNSCSNCVVYSKYFRYMDAEDCDLIEEVLQRRCLVDTDMPDLVRCEDCGSEWISRCEHFTCEKCGRKQCCSCRRPYDDIHKGRSCKEAAILAAQTASAGRLETRINELVVRRCPKCGIQGIKASGCNKMTCPCGTMYCYLCMEVIQGYAHFENGKCATHADAEAFDQERIRLLTQ